MRQQKFKIGDRVRLLPEATTFALNDPEAFTISFTNEVDSTYDNAVIIGLSAAMGETIKGSVIRIGAEDDNNDYFYGVQIDSPASYWAFYDVKHLRKI